MVKHIQYHLESVKHLAANSLLLGNSAIQWISDADTVLKLVGTLIAIPVAIFSAKSFYWTSRIKKAEALKKEKELEEK